MTKTCIDLTIFEFICCQFRQDFTCLGDNHVEVWAKIQEEWAMLTENKKYFDVLDTLNEINTLYAKLLEVDVCLAVLSFRYSQEHIDALKKAGYHVTFDRNDRNGYEKDIQLVISKSKGIKVQLEIAVNRIKGLQKGNEKGQTEDHFMNDVSMISKNLGFPIPIKSVTMYEYAAHIRQHNKQSRNHGK